LVRPSAAEQASGSHIQGSRAWRHTVAFKAGKKYHRVVQIIARVFPGERYGRKRAAPYLYKEPIAYVSGSGNRDSCRQPA